MNKHTAVQQAGGVKALAEMLGITAAAVSQWGEDLPQAREWQLRLLKPDWFPDQNPPQGAVNTAQTATDSVAERQAA